MAEGWEQFTEEEFRTAFCGVRLQAERFNIDRNDPDISQFLIHTAEVIAQERANSRQLQVACHVPNNWQKIWKKLEELGIDEEFKL